MVRLAAYVIRMMVPWLALSLVGAAVVFVASQAVRVTPVFMGLHDSGLRIAAALGLLLVPVTGWALTPAFAIGVMATFGRMSARGEQTALDAAGVPRWRCAVGPALLAVVLVAASAWIWLDASWRSQAMLRRMALDMAGEALVGRMEEGRFLQPVKGITFFARESRGGSFRSVMLEDARDPDRVRQVFGGEASVEFDSTRREVRVGLSDGRVFMQPGPGGTPGTMRFAKMSLTIPVGDELFTATGFIPDTMSEPTSRLMSGELSGRRGFELLRRFAGPVGLAAIALACLVLALGPRWRRGWSATAAGGAVFAGYHVLARLCESLVETGDRGAFLAAFAPSVAVLFVTVVMVVFRMFMTARAPRRDC